MIPPKSQADIYAQMPPTASHTPSANDTRKSPTAETKTEAGIETETRPDHSAVGARLAWILGRWVAWLQRQPGLVIAVCLIWAAVSLWSAQKQLHFKTDRSDLVQPTSPAARHWQRFEAEFGSDEDLIVMVVGTNEPRQIVAIEAIAAEMKQKPALFDRICYRLDVETLRAKGLFQLPVAELEQLTRQVEQLEPLFRLGWQALTVEHLLLAARLQAARTQNHATGSLSDPDQTVNPPPAAATIKAVWDRWTRLPSGWFDAINANPDEELALLSRLTPILSSLGDYLRTGTTYQPAWRQEPTSATGHLVDQVPRYFFSQDRSMLFLRAVPKQLQIQFGGCEAAVAEIRDILHRQQNAFPELEFGLTGLPVLEVDEMAAAQRASLWATGFSILGVSLLFWISFRGLLPLCHAFVTLFVAGAWTLGWITWTVGHLNILSVSFLVTLIGLGIDYSILWLSRYDSKRCRGMEPGLAGWRTAERIGPGLLLGALTTVAAFWTTMATSFLGLRELGWIAGSGILFCLLATFTLLPALLTLMPPAVSTSEPKVLPGQCSQPVKSNFRSGDQQRSTVTGLRMPIHVFATPDQPVWHALSHRPRLVLTISLLIGGLSACFVPFVPIDFNLLHLQPQHLPSVVWEHRLLNATGTSGWYAISVVESREAVLELKERLSQQPSIGRIVEIASLIPTDQEKKKPYIQAIRQQLQLFDQMGPIPDSVRASVPQATRPAQRLLQELDRWLPARNPTNRANQAQALEQNPIPAPLKLLPKSQQTQLLALLTEIAHQLRQLDAAEADRRLATFQRLLREELVQQLQQLQVATDPEPVTLADLPPSLTERLVGKTGKWAVQIFARDSIWDWEPLTKFCQEVQAVDPQATGKAMTAQAALAEMLAGYRRTTLLALLVVFGALWATLRRFREACLGMVPLVLGTVIMFAAMYWLQIPLNPANLIVLPLIFGIGVDYGIHILHDAHHQQTPYLLGWRLTKALLLSSFTTILGFAALMLAPHRGMASIGAVLAIGVTACTLAALTTLPALLWCFPGQTHRSHQTTFLAKATVWSKQRYRRFRPWSNQTQPNPTPYSLPATALAPQLHDKSNRASASDPNAATTPHFRAKSAAQRHSA